MTVQGIQQPPLAVSDVLFAVLADGQPKGAVVVLVADRRIIGDPARGDGLTDAAPGERRSRSRPHPLSWRISIEAQLAVAGKPPRRSRELRAMPIWRLDWRHRVVR